MTAAPIPENESDRLACLWDCQILDTFRETAFDDITSLAASLCETPVALVSLVDERRQWFKSAVGTDLPETGRDESFCAHAIAGSDPFIIRDATADPRTSDNSLVTGPPGIRFYAGVPLITDDGFAIGTLCVIDTISRDLTPQQIDILRKLASQVVTQIELRRGHRRLAEMIADLKANQSELRKQGRLLTRISTCIPGVIFQLRQFPDGRSCIPYTS